MNLPQQANKNIDLNELLQLATDQSSSGRALLAQTIADIGLTDDTRLNERETELAFDILHKLIQDVEMGVRRDLARRLAPREDVPRELIVTLANDQIDVAYPVLISNLLLTDEDLIAITRSQAAAHQIAVTLREHVSTAVSEALVATENVDVIDSLLRNPSAELSEPTKKLLVDMSRDVPPLRRPLLQRTDLNATHAWQMYQWVGEALKTYITNKYPDEIGEIDIEIEAAVREALASEKSKQTRDVAETVSEIERRGAITAKVLIQTLRDQDIELFEVLFAKAARVDFLAMPMIVYDPSGEPFAIACKACNFSGLDFEKLYLLLTKSLSGGTDNGVQNLHTVGLFYKRLDANAARKILDEWRRTPATAWRTSP